MKKLKLNALKNAELKKREMTNILGGACCNCGCVVAGVQTNAKANCDNGYTISKGGTLVSIKDNGDGSYSPC